MKKFILPISFKDERGKIIDLLEKENINAITYITFNKGAIRGNHFHKKTTQWGFVISGTLLIKSKKPEGRVTQMTIKKGDLFVDEKMESHAIKALKNSEVIFFTKGPRGGKEYESDTFHLKDLLINS
jgi:dTDP-4-dehydrorhamnose 3,5-epimerase-like enzyme